MRRAVRRQGSRRGDHQRGVGGGPRCNGRHRFQSARGDVAAISRLAKSRGCAVLIGTTGHDERARAEIAQAAQTIPLILAPNTSLGVNLLLRLTELAARALDESYDLEIFEAHHRHKQDAPSGTALALGRSAAAGRGVALDDVAAYARHGTTGERARGAIGFSVFRGGDVVGEHTVTFAGSGERLELTHRATDRMTFARGAVRAARWLNGRAPGAYSMQDVLGLGLTTSSITGHGQSAARG